MRFLLSSFIFAILIFTALISTVRFAIDKEKATIGDALIALVCWTVLILAIGGMLHV